jgi:hypothetical protein
MADSDAGSWHGARRWPGGLCRNDARLLGQRRRKIGDPTLSYWRVSMASLAVTALLWLSSRLIPTWAQAPQTDLLLGILLIFGFAVAVINGMLCKIVPFLAWFHLQAQLLGRARIPNMKQLLPDAAIRRQGLGLSGRIPVAAGGRR